LESPAIHTGGKHARQQFNKVKLIYRRAANQQTHARSRQHGKENQAYDTVKKSFETINTRTKENPVQLLIQAVENAGPREETVR